MRDYMIMTDSCCDLNAAEIKELGITVLPLDFLLDGKMMRNTPDHTDITPEKFYEEIAAGKECSTAALNVGQYSEAMKAALDAGKDVLCICFSSGLSTTYQSACIAAEDLRGEYPDAKILVVDSLSASRGQGLLVYRAVREMREKNLDIEALAEFIRSDAPHICQWFIADDLNQLKRGGRIGTAAAMTGSMLNIKPILRFDSEGKIVTAGKARGTKAAIKALADKVEELGIEPQKNQPMFVCHANCPENVAILKQMLSERFGVTDVRDDFTGPVIGAHSGCGTLALFFVGTER